MANTATNIGRSSQWSHILPGILRNGKPFNRAVTFFTDFVGKTDVSTTAEEEKFLLTAAGAGAATVADRANGWLDSVTDAADNSENNYQGNGESFEVVPGKRLILETIINVDAVALNDLFAGLSVRNAAVLDAIPDDYLGFRIPDGLTSQELQFVARKDGVETVVQTGVSMVDGEDIVLRIECFGRRDQFRAEAWINGLRKAQLSQSQDLPDDELLTPTLEHRNASAVARTLQSDYFLCVMDRAA